MSNTTPAQQLSEIIKSYLESNPKISLNRLANITKVSEASLRRVVSLETKNSPSLSLTLKILRHITKEKSLKRLCKDCHGPLKDYLYSELGMENLSEEQEEYKKQLESKVSDPTMFHVIALAGSNAGVSEEQVEEFFGVEGLKALLSLYEHDFISLENGRFHTNEKGMSFNRDIFIPVLNKALEKIDAKGSPLEMDNYFYLWTASVNNKAVQKIRKQQLDHFQKLKDICKSEVGDKHIFFFGAVDSYEKDGLKK